MSLIINHNLSALNTHRNLSASGAGMSKAIEKLSSGYKINVGADDPSGLIISEQLRSQISGLERAVRNSSEAFNLIGIAEGALNEMNSILKKMRALAIHAANNGITSPEQVAADQAEMDSGIATLDRIANTTRYSDQYLLNGSKELVYDIDTSVNEPTDHALLDTKLTRVDQIFKRDGVKMSVDYTGMKSRYQANTSTSAQRAYLEADSAFPQSQVDGTTVTAKQEFILTGTSGSRLFSFKAGTHLGTIVDNINNVKDSTGIGATLTFASDVRIDKSTTGVPEGGAPVYGNPPTPAKHITGYNDGSYVYNTGDVQIYGAGLNNESTSKVTSVCITPDAADAFKVGYNCDGDGKIYAKVVDKATNSIEYYKDKDCTMLIGKGDESFFAATNNSGIPSSPLQNLDGIFIKLNSDNVQNMDVFEIAVVGQRMDNMKDMNVTGIAGWANPEECIMSGVDLGYNTSPKGELYFKYTPLTFEANGTTVATFKVEAFTDGSYDPKYLVASSGVVENNLQIPVAADPAAVPPVPAQKGGQTVRLESVEMANGKMSGLNITMNLPKEGMIESKMAEVAADLADPANTSAAATQYQTLDGNLTTAKGTLATDVTAEAATAKATAQASTEYTTIASNTNSDAVLDAVIAAFSTYVNAGNDPAKFTVPPSIYNSTEYTAIKTINATASQKMVDDLAADLTSNATIATDYQAVTTIERQMQTIVVANSGSNVDTAMPKGQDVGGVSFTNLGMRIYAEGYGSAETIRIQNKAGEMFYQYRGSDSMEKVVVKAETTVQVAGQDAQISLNGAPIYTTGLVANTTTPDFSGALVFNAGKLGETTLAVAGYENGSIFSRATSLQGIEENEPWIVDSRRHFEPPAVNATLGTAAAGANPASGLLDAKGNPVNLYADFSQIDPTVEVKITDMGLQNVTFFYDGATNELTINADDMGGGAILNVTIKVNPENLEKGYYITEDPALKGLYIKTDKLVDLKKSNTDSTTVTKQIEVSSGDLLTELNTYATHPRNNTTETMSNFLGGMQYQLGNTEGDQDRTIYSIQSMAMSNLGSITYNGVDYCLQNVLGGGPASLSKDPILAMRILGQAVDDVSTLRARLGAFQSNMLQTNINSLNVAIENITKTESAIRDTDMAEESTQFTRFQIMQQAGTSMLAQANQVSQNVLSLLQ